MREFDSMFPDKLFYQYVDSLVDGRYISNIHEDANRRGSTNQTMYQFVDGAAVTQTTTPTHKWSLQVSEDNHIYMAGIPKKGDLTYVSSQLADAGIKMKFK